MRKFLGAQVHCCCCCCWGRRHGHPVLLHGPRGKIKSLEAPAHRPLPQRLLSFVPRPLVSRPKKKRRKKYKNICTLSPWRPVIRVFPLELLSLSFLYFPPSTNCLRAARLGSSSATRNADEPRLFGCPMRLSLGTCFGPGKWEEIHLNLVEFFEKIAVFIEIILH